MMASMWLKYGDFSNSDQIKSDQNAESHQNGNNK